jgi:polysaccharide pyruvyl transferase WcaK-like protein
VTLSPTDLEYASEAARLLGPPVEVNARYNDLTEVLAAIRESQVFVGVKLHSVVFASAFFVPSVMLAYQPKCLDFQASLEREAYTVRTDAIDIPLLVELVDDLAEHTDDHRRFLFQQVTRRHQELLAEIQRIRVSLFRLPPDPPGLHTTTPAPL